MKIVLVTIGSRGDVQPMLALCLAFRDAGHQAVLVGPPDRASWAKSLDCPYLAHGRDMTAFIDSLGNAHSIAAAAGFIRKLRHMVADQFSSLPDVIAGADLVVGASLCFGLSSVAEVMGIPYRFIAFTPQMIPSKQHPCPIFKRHGLPAWWNAYSWQFLFMGDRLNFTWIINRHRRRWGLAPLSRAWMHILGPKLFVATDAALGGLPEDGCVPAEQTGYMRLRQPHCCLPALRRFLAAGPPPVYAGFGSMPQTDQVRLFPLIKSAARHARQRLVLARFWNDRSEPDPGGDVFFISRYPHEQLFARMAAVIHHGGAGTTATAACSGVPQIVVPHVLDQYYWAHRIHHRGLGPRPLRRSDLNARVLGRAIEAAVSIPGFAEKARQIQCLINQDGDGAKVTAQAILNSL